MNMLGIFPVLVLGAGLVLNAATSTVSPDAQAQAQVPNDEIAPEIIAVQIRKQGFTCTNPQKAERDEKASKPDLPVWILTCENATYRVRLVGNMADHVEKL